jgi:tetratricopeptide (TPR) repeat protein
MRSCLLILLLSLTAVASGQTSSPSNPADSKSGDSGPSKTSRQPTPNLEPPRSDRVNINDLGNSDGQSSSKDTQIDLSPPPDDAKAHPDSSEALSDAGAEDGDVNEMHPWDPHRAAKDIEVGDFYFKRKNYRAAEDRYREALYYKDNDAMATYRLGVCLEKLNELSEARTEFENYLKILPNGPQAEDARKAIDRLKAADAGAKAAK